MAKVLRPISFIVATVRVVAFCLGEFLAGASPLISIQEVVRGTLTSGDHFSNMCQSRAMHNYVQFAKQRKQTETEMSTKKAN